MFRRQLTLFIAALGIIAALFFGYAYAHMRAMRRAQYWGIGAQLIKTTNSPSLVAIGPDLRSRLEVFLSPVDVLSIPGDVEQASHGDVPAPIGDGTASGYVIIKNQKGERLGIRLRPDGSTGKYHVIGFWMPEPR